MEEPRMNKIEKISHEKTKLKIAPDGSHILIPEVKDSEMIDPTDDAEREFYEKINKIAVMVGASIPSVSDKQDRWVKYSEYPNLKYYQRENDEPIFNYAMEKIKPITIKILLEKKLFETLKDVLTEGIKYYGNKEVRDKVPYSLSIWYEIPEPSEDYDTLKDFCIVKQEFLKDYPDDKYWLVFDEMDLKLFREIIITMVCTVYSDHKEYRVNAFYNDYYDKERFYYFTHQDEYDKYLAKIENHENNCRIMIDRIEKAIKYTKEIEEKEKRRAEKEIARFLEHVFNPNMDF